MLSQDRARLPRVDMELSVREEYLRQKRRQQVKPRLGEELLAQRFRDGVDLWSGEKLVGTDKADWYRLQAGGREITQTRDDGEYSREER